MASTKEIKQKIKSTGNIKKITKTMEMVSVSKMRKAVDQALASRAYARYALELLVDLSKDKDVSHPLMERGEGEKELIILVASNKGLCGGYHTNILKALSKYLKDKLSTPSTKSIEVVTIGKYAEKIAKKLNLPVFASFNNFSEASGIEQTKELSNLVRTEYQKSEYSSVKILYTEFLKSTTYKPTIHELFPISAESVKNIMEEPNDLNTITEKDYSNFVFEPSVSEILSSILPGLVDVVVYQTLAEAYASEHSARMFAMKNAGDNATTILDGLMLSYNNARQGGITRELSEIVAGAEALNTN